MWLKHLRELYAHYRSSAAVSAAKLASGAGVGQVVVLASTPILTRLYGPDSFGVSATFVALLSFIDVVSSLRYELAIPLPEREEEASSILHLCFSLVLITALITFVVIYGWTGKVTEFAGIEDHKWLLFLMPIAVLASGFYQPLNYYMIRKERFGDIARIYTERSLVSTITSMLLFRLGPIGLVGGTVISQIGACLSIAKCRLVRLRLRKLVDICAIRQGMRRYYKFGLMTTPSSFISVLGAQAPVLLIAYYFGKSDVGQFALAQKLIVLPASLISSSFSQVFLSKASSYPKGKGLLRVMVKFSRRLLIAALVAALLISVGARWIPLVVGARWEAVVGLTIALLPLFVGQVVVSSVSTSFLVAEKNGEELAAQVVQLVVKLLPLIVALHLKWGFVQTILCYSIATLMGYVTYFLLMYKAISRTEVNVGIRAIGEYKRSEGR